MINTFNTIIDNNTILEINTLLKSINQQVRDFEVSTGCRIHNVEQANAYNQALNDFNLIKSALVPYQMILSANQHKIDENALENIKALSEEYFNIIRINGDSKSERVKAIDDYLSNGDELEYILFRTEMAKLEFRRAQEVFNNSEKPNLTELANTINQSDIMNQPDCDYVMETESSDFDLEGFTTLTPHKNTMEWDDTVYGMETESSDIDLEGSTTLTLHKNTMEWDDAVYGMETESNDLDLGDSTPFIFQKHTLQWFDSDSSDESESSDIDFAIPNKGLMFTSSTNTVFNNSTFDLSAFVDCSSDDDNVNGIKNSY